MTAVSKPFPAATPSAILPVRMVRRAIAALDRIPYWLIALAARIFPAADVLAIGPDQGRRLAVSSRAPSRCSMTNIDCR